MAGPYKGKGKKRRRRMTKFRINEFSGVDRPAMEPAVAVIMKRADDDPEFRESDTLLSFGKRLVAKGVDRRHALLQTLEAYRTHKRRAAGALEKFEGAAAVMTGANEGHSHLLWMHGQRGGETSYAVTEGSEMGHDHPWIVNDDGTVTIGMNDGHDHVVDAAAVLAAMRELMLESSDAPEAVIDIVFARADGEEVDVEKMEFSEIVKDLDEGRLVCSAFADSTMPDGTLPIRVESDLQKAIEQAGAEGIQRQAARHIVKRARALGLEGSLTEEILSIAKAGPAGEPTPGGKPVTKPDGTGGKGDDSSALDKATAKIEELEKKLETAAAVAALSDSHRTHYSGLEKGEAQTAFLAKSEEDRQSEIDDLSKGDPVIYKASDGAEYRESDGENTIRLAKQADSLAKRLAKSEAERSIAKLEKRADDELGNMPGDVKVRTSVLKAVDAIEDDEVRKGALELLKAGNTAMSKGTQRLGTSRGLDLDTPSDAEGQLNKLATELSKKEGIDFYEAYDRVAESNPQLAKAAVDGGE